MKKLLVLILLILVAVILYLRTFSNFSKESFCVLVVPSLHSSYDNFEKVREISQLRLDSCTSSLKIAKGALFSDSENKDEAPFDNSDDLINFKKNIENFFDVIIPSEDDLVVIENLPENLKYVYKSPQTFSLPRNSVNIQLSVVTPLKKNIFTSEDIDKYIETKTIPTNLENNFTILFAEGENTAFYKDGIFNTLDIPDVFIEQSEINSHETINDKIVDVNFNTALKDILLIKYDFIVKDKTELTILNKNIELISLEK